MLNSLFSKASEHTLAVHGTNAAAVVVSYTQVINNILQVLVLCASLTLSCVTIYYKVKSGRNKAKSNE